MHDNGTDAHAHQSPALRIATTEDAAERSGQLAARHAVMFILLSGGRPQVFKKESDDL